MASNGLKNRICTTSIFWVHPFIIMC